jgi:hypothetical protein
MEEQVGLPISLWVESLHPRASHTVSDELVVDLAEHRDEALAVDELFIGGALVVANRASCRGRGCAA